MIRTLLMAERRLSPTFGPRINGRGTNKQGVAVLGKAKQVGGSK